MPDPFDFVDKIGRDAFKERLQDVRVVTGNNVVVTYKMVLANPIPSRLLKTLFAPEQVDEKLKELLAANPDLDLTKIEAALGISIIDIQRPAKPAKVEPPVKKRILT